MTVTHTTTRRHRARLLVPAAIAALAFTATTAAADTSPTAVTERTATAHDRRGPRRSRRPCSAHGSGSGTAISPRRRASSLPTSGCTPPSSTAVTAAPSEASTAW